VREWKGEGNKTAATRQWPIAVDFFSKSKEDQKKPGQCLAVLAGHVLKVSLMAVADKGF